MDDWPTSAMYRLQVKVGHLVAASLHDGATYAEVRAALERQLTQIEFSRATGLTFNDYELPAHCVVCGRKVRRRDRNSSPSD